MLDWLRRHGVDDVVMSCGHLADGVRDVLGDGSSVGRAAALHGGAAAAGDRRRAEVRRGHARRALPDAQRRHADRPRPDARRSRRTRRAGARATLGAVPGRGPARLRARAAERRRLGHASSSRSRRRTRSTPTTSPRACTCSSAPCSTLLVHGEPASIERDVFPRLVGNGLYGHVCAGLLEGHRDARALPARRRSTSSRAPCAPRSPRAWATTFVCVEDERRPRRAHRPGRAGRERLPDRRGRADRRARGARARRAVGEGTTIESAVVMEGATIGAHCTLRGCIVAAGVTIGDHCVIDGHERDRRGRRARGRQRRLQRRADLPGRTLPGRGAAVLMDSLTREAIAAVDSTGQIDEVLGLAEHLSDALWRVDSARARGRSTRPAGVIVAGMGGSASGARLARRRARVAAAAADVRLRRLRAARAGRGRRRSSSPRATPATPRRRCPPTTTRSRAARRGSWPRPAARWPSARARDGVPVVPIPGGFQPRAAIGYSLVGALEAAALAARRRRCATRSRRRRRWPSELVAEWGPDAPED